MNQFVFELELKKNFNESDFFVNSTNKKAVDLVSLWPDWHNKAAIIYGETKSGKSHLGNIWMQRSDAFIVLPGGVGSLDELAEVMASNQLGIINKPIGILNTAGYYDHLIAWMNKAVAEGFISDANFDELIITDSCEDLVERIVSEVRPDDSDWTNRLGL